VRNESQIHIAASENNIPAKKGRLGRAKESNRKWALEDRGAVITENITFELPPPAGTLAGEKVPLVPAGRPEAVKTMA